MLRKDVDRTGEQFNNVDCGEDVVAKRGVGFCYSIFESSIATAIALHYGAYCRSVKPVVESAMKECEACGLVVFNFGYVDDAASVASYSNGEYLFEGCSMISDSEAWVAVGS